ncbi:MAG: hypothetical protein ACT4P0_08270 [Panacagrimonas sp.]
MSGLRQEWIARAALLWGALAFGTPAPAQPAPGVGDVSGNRQKLVCWTEHSGHRACGDAVPPRYAGQEQRVLDGSGRTLHVIPPALTAEQRAARDARAQIAATARREAETQAAYDRALLATYASPQELADLRDDRLALLDTRIQLAEDAAARDEEVAGPSASRGLEASRTSTLRAIDAMRRDRDAVCARFARDIRRFQDLKGHAAGERFESPCPPPGSRADAGQDATDLASARAFFEQLIELERDFDPSRFAHYADSAVLRSAHIDARGQVSWLSVPTAVQIARLRSDLSAAKTDLRTFRYSRIRLERELQARVRISGLRAPDRGGAAIPFEMLLKPSGKSWLIVEEAM